ncbi:MAG: M48 family metalloprotease [Pseudomonadota bacterium]
MSLVKSFRNVLAGLAAGAVAVVSPATHAQGISLLRDAEIENFLDDYSRPIFKAANLNPDSIEILLVNDQTLNAFAGGRYMGVNTGLLTIADTPNQIEAVIAHEAGHLAGGHTARTQDAISAATRPMLLSLVLAAGAIAAGAPEAGIGLLGLGQTVGTANFLKYSRGQESTADQLSITYLDKLGKSSKGALELWTKARNEQILRNRAINPYRVTHPLANERLTALRERAEASPHFNKSDSPEEIERLRMIQAKIKGFVQEERITLRQYPLADQSDAARYARAVAYYRSSQIDKAQSEINTLIALYPDNPYFHELAGQMLFEHGMVAASVAPHRRSVELDPDEALFRINLGRALVALEEPASYNEAIAELRNALLLEPNSSFAWFELARAHGGLGENAMADLATAESRYHAGAKGEANLFARRAMTGLKKGTPEWRQAIDIVKASQPEKGQVVPLPTGIEEETGDPAEPGPETPGTQDVPDPELKIEQL